ncbi:hypothetical protein [Haladaptatus sp. DFWS20]|uniref:hypothetical protein n=1 Tax=Haladaptatus sp. DFWS20 TaxID=3403467 RepID=UPI003EC0CAAD
MFERSHGATGHDERHKRIFKHTTPHLRPDVERTNPVLPPWEEVGFGELGAVPTPYERILALQRGEDVKSKHSSPNTHRQDRVVSGVSESRNQRSR